MTDKTLNLNELDLGGRVSVITGGTAGIGLK